MLLIFQVKKVHVILSILLSYKSLQKALMQAGILKRDTQKTLFYYLLVVFFSYTFQKTKNYFVESKIWVGYHPSLHYNTRLF